MKINTDFFESHGHILAIEAIKWRSQVCWEISGNPGNVGG
jgi:hypothetical protein